MKKIPPKCLESQVNLPSINKRQKSAKKIDLGKYFITLTHPYDTVLGSEAIASQHRSLLKEEGRGVSR